MLSTVRFTPVKKDHQGVPVVKLVYAGPTMAGKTTALTLLKILATLENPESVYKFLKLEDPTGRTLFFDHAVFGLGKNERTGLPYLKYHIFTVPGQDRHVGQRKVVLRGAHGLIIVIDSEKSRWEENKRSITELVQLIGDKIAAGVLPYYIMLNKMDLPKEERISSLEVGRLLVEAGAHASLRDAAVRIVEASCLQARNDLQRLLTTTDRSQLVNERGYLKKELRPPSVQRIVKPVEALIREILVLVMKQQKEQGTRTQSSVLGRRF